MTIRELLNKDLTVPMATMALGATTLMNLSAGCQYDSVGTFDGMGVALMIANGVTAAFYTQVTPIWDKGIAPALFVGFLGTVLGGYEQAGSAVVCDYLQAIF